MVSIRELPDSTVLARLAEDVGDLELFGSSWQAAAFSASVLQKTLGARAVFVHAIENSELRVVGAKGAKANDLLGEIAAVDDDFVGSAVAANLRPLAMTFDGELPRVLPERFTAVGAKTAFAAVPIIASGRCVGLIEVIDAAASGVVTEASELVANRLLALFSKPSR